MQSKHAAPRTLAKASGAVRQHRSCRSGEISHIRREISRAPVVLIVERDALLRWALHETLTSAGFRVLAAPTTACAEAWLQQIDQELSLALIEDDVWPLPAPVKAILETRWPTLPIVVMLHGEHPAIEARVREHGASEVLVKPFDLPDLIALAEHLTTHPAR
jgi:two-component system, NtrC family, nitrogen regulation response regulator GlnG